jgi:hypothetical protein
MHSPLAGNTPWNLMHIVGIRGLDWRGLMHSPLAGNTPRGI